MRECIHHQDHFLQRVCCIVCTALQLLHTKSGKFERLARRVGPLQRLKASSIATAISQAMGRLKHLREHEEFQRTKYRPTPNSYRGMSVGSNASVQSKQQQAVPLGKQTGAVRKYSRKARKTLTTDSHETANAFHLGVQPQPPSSHSSNLVASGSAAQSQHRLDMDNQVEKDALLRLFKW